MNNSDLYYVFNAPMDYYTICSNEWENPLQEVRIGETEVLIWRSTNMTEERQKYYSLVQGPAWTWILTR